MQSGRRHKIPKAQWPKVLRPWRYVVKGICLGGCIDGGGMGASGLPHADVLAHAHAHPQDPHKGYLCFGQRRRPHTLVVLHELAHLLTGEGHTRRWRRMVLAVGGTLDPVPGWIGDYHPVKRDR